MTMANPTEQQLVLLLGDYLLNGFEPTGDPRHEAPEVSPEIGNPVLNDIVFHEIGELVAKDRQLLEAIEKARRYSDGPPPAKLRKSIEMRLERRLRNDPDLLGALGALLPQHADGAGQQLRSPRFARIRGAVNRLLAAASLAAIIAVVVAATAWLDGQQLGSLTAIEVFATAVLAFLPGWLFVRFLAFRAGALWNEYVLNLHRLNFDACQHLPRPPENSIYFRKWWAAGGWVRERAPTIYQQKFDAYYGRNVSRASHEQDPIVRTETLFPVLLMTAVTAAGWVAVFQDGRLLAGAEPSRLSDMLGFAFVGAYVFNLQTFVRRFFQGDLKASAYAAGAVRIITALVLVGVLYWLPEPDLQGRTGAVVAFVIGIFPLVGIQVLSRAASVVLRTVVPTLRSDYPLNELDGLNIWYETRLLEEGIEDMQNLTTMNLVDVMLHTRVPLGRLVDWLDQATLYINLSRSPRVTERRRAMENAKAARDAIRAKPNWARRPAAALEPFEPTHPRELLRRCGIRTATEFVAVFRPLLAEGTQDSPEYVTAKSAETWLVSKDAAWSGALRPLAQILANDTALQPVWSWHNNWRQQDDGVDAHTCQRDGAALQTLLVRTVVRN
jgi:hypothetical protein